MLKHRIIPTLLYNENEQCVKPIKFQKPGRVLGTLPQYLKVIEKRNADELILLFVGQADKDRTRFFKRLSLFTANLFCPITFGGTIGSLDDIQMALFYGADKVAIKTNTQIIYDASRKFGSQAIVGVIDFNEHNCLIDVARYSKWLEDQGVGEILITDIQRDGTLNGYNLDIIRICSNSVGVSVIGNGGAGHAGHMVEAIKAGANAVAASSLFLYTETTLKMCAEELHKNNIPVRLHG